MDMQKVFCYTMAQDIYAQVEWAKAKNNTLSARQAYFRAASYYRGVDFFLISNWSDPRNDILWEQQLDAFDKATALLDTLVEKFSIPSHSPNVSGTEFQVIGRFFKVPNANYQTPTIIAGSGYDRSQEGLYRALGVEILKRGYNFVTYEGRGQPTVHRQQSIGFIPNWYKVAAPVVDYLNARIDVDMTRLATLAPIIASTEHRVTEVLAIGWLIFHAAGLEQTIALLHPQIVRERLSR